MTSMSLSFSRIPNNSGGAKRDRTADLLRARQALSQLSYSPVGTIVVNSEGSVLLVGGAKRDRTGRPGR